MEKQQSTHAGSSAWKANEEKFAIHDDFKAAKLW